MSGQPLRSSSVGERLYSGLFQRFESLRRFNRTHLHNRAAIYDAAGPCRNDVRLAENDAGLHCGLVRTIGIKRLDVYSQVSVAFR